MTDLAGNCMRVTGKAQGSIDAKIEPMHASMQDLKNGKWCCSQAHGQPGIISNVKMSKTGKHGHAKFTFNLAFPFTGQASQEMFPGHTHLSRPIMEKREWQFLAIDDDMADMITCLDGEFVEQTARMDPNFVDKQGNEKGAEFHQFVADFEAKEDYDNAIFVSILEGPVEEKKGNIWVRQVEKWCIKAVDAEN